MRNGEKLSVLGLSDGDLVMMVSGSSTPSPSANDLSFNQDGSAVNPAAFQQHIRNDSNLMSQLFQTDPQLAQAILGNVLNKLQQILRERNRHKSEMRRQQDEELALLYADPFDVEAQKKIEAAIRQVMLYVDMEVNGVPLKDELEAELEELEGAELEEELLKPAAPVASCEQNDIHSPQITIQESLIYSAFLRLPKEISKEEKMPLFRFEAAAIVMRTIRNIVDTGRTVVYTIHQPSIDIFEAYDELLLMKRGQVIYSGPLGNNSHKIIEYFEVIPGVPKIKEKYNPATWMLEVSSVAAERRLGMDLNHVWKQWLSYWRSPDSSKTTFDDTSLLLARFN